MRRIALLLAALSLGSCNSQIARNTNEAKGSNDAAARCSMLASGRLDGGEIVSANFVAEKTSGLVSDSLEGPLKPIAAHCEVNVVLRPTNDSEIKVIVWLPASNWNGRFEGVGNGGFAGMMNMHDLAISMRRGYATATTDTGHQATVLAGDWAKGHPEKVVDFAYRAIHLTAVASKSIIVRFYGKVPDHSYFASCSNGGRQALVEISRYPEDYDGVVAGAPAEDFVGLLTADFGWNAQVLLQNPISATKVPAISAAVFSQCDKIDGVVDGIIADPRECRFEPEVLRCKTEEDDRCLTDGQIAALKKIYRGPVTSDGKQLYPGFSPGSEPNVPSGPGWGPWILGTPKGTSLELELMTNLERDFITDNPNWQIGQFDLSRDYPLAVRAVGALLNVNQPDLSAFKRRGGKLIMYHGWSDPAIPPLATIRYMEEIRRKMGTKTDNFVRLFMVPGMQHCQFGAAPWAFNPLAARSPAQPQRDMAASLEQWVEKGVAPQEIIAFQPVVPTSVIDDAPNIAVVRTGLLCAFPSVARYDGKGDPKVASSFSCKAPANAL